MVLAIENPSGSFTLLDSCRVPICRPMNRKFQLREQLDCSPAYRYLKRTVTMVTLTHRLQALALLSKSVLGLAPMGLRSWLAGILGPRARDLLLTRP